MFVNLIILYFLSKSVIVMATVEKIMSLLTNINEPIVSSIVAISICPHPDRAFVQIVGVKIVRTSQTKVVFKIRVGMKISSAHNDSINIRCATIFEVASFTLKPLNQWFFTDSVWPVETHWRGSPGTNNMCCAILEATNSISNNLDH